MWHGCTSCRTPSCEAVHSRAVAVHPNTHTLAAASTPGLRNDDEDNVGPARSGVLVVLGTLIKFLLGGALLAGAVRILGSGRIYKTRAPVRISSRAG